MHTEKENNSGEMILRGHETGDLRVRRIMITATVLALSVPALLLLVWLMFKSMAGKRYAGKLEPTVAWKQNISGAPSFPEPHLIIAPHEQLLEFRAKEELELNTYGWINRTQGVVRIPIERAMDLILEHGLPVRGPNVNSIGKSEYELIQERRKNHEPEERK